MAKKTLVEQIKDTQIELEKVRAEKKQKENQLAKIQKQEREKEHRVRTLLSVKLKAPPSGILF